MNNKTSEYVNSIFEQPWWLDIVAPNAWEEISIKEEGKVIARWPIVKIGRSIGMPQYTQTLGFWLSKDKLLSDHYLNERKRITNLLLDQLPKNKGIYIRCDSNVDYFLPMFWKQFVISPYVSYRINNLTNIDIIYKKFNNKVKGKIRHANNIVEVKVIDNIEILLELLDKTKWMKNRKYPISKNLLREIYNACKNHNSGKLLYAIDRYCIVYSGCLIVYDKNRCYYLISGNDPKYLSSGASSLIIWEAIKFASTVSNTFDFEGSMVEGVEQFFRQFGGIPTVSYYIRRQQLAMEFLKLLRKALQPLTTFTKW